MVQLVGIDPGLLTAYLPGSKGGGTRHPGNVIPFDHEVIPVPPTWKASPAMAAALVELDHDVTAAGGARLRLVEVNRSPVVQATERGKWNRWVAAGRPLTREKGFDPVVMRTSYVAEPGESGHGWGGSVDIDQDCLAFPNAPRGTDDAMGVFWGIAERHGFTPIVASASVHQSECWHFDHLGPLQHVVDLARANGQGPHANPLAQVVGTTLFGTYQWPDGRDLERLVQARLLIAGYWTGWPDGLLGAQTRAALTRAGVPVSTTDPSQILAYLDRFGIGAAEAAKL